MFQVGRKIRFFTKSFGIIFTSEYFLLNYVSILQMISGHLLCKYEPTTAKVNELKRKWRIVSPSGDSKKI